MLQSSPRHLLLPPTSPPCHSRNRETHCVHRIRRTCRKEANLDNKIRQPDGSGGLSEALITDSMIFYVRISFDLVDTCCMCPPTSQISTMIPTCVDWVIPGGSCGQALGLQVRALVAEGICQGWQIELSLTLHAFHIVNDHMIFDITI